MDPKVFRSLQESLQEQRQNLSQWLDSATAEEKELRLGPASETAVENHLQVLETAVARAEDQTLGICTVCNDYVEVSRLEVDYTASVCIDHFSDEQKRKLESELELSQKVQKALLPQELPQIPGLSLAAYSQPARIVGGDYFDFFHFKDGSPGLVVADVMGKGIAASMLMASLQASLRILVTEYNSPADVIRRLNGLFVHNIHLTKFVTLVLARFEPQTKTLSFCNAGHNPPLLLRRSDGEPHAIDWLQPTGAAIGLIEEFVFDVQQVQLQPDDTILLYTDGVTEARDTTDAEYGVTRLTEVVRGNSQLSPAELLYEIRRSLQNFTGGMPLEDDTTIVAVRVLDSGS